MQMAVRPKPCGRDAGRSTGVFDANIAAVFGQSGWRVGLFPEKKKTAMLEVIQELIILKETEKTFRLGYRRSRGGRDGHHADVTSASLATGVNDDSRRSDSP
jgi:hypothetical protein